MSEPAPKHLGFALRMAVNLQNGLEPLAGFDEDDFREMDRIAGDLTAAANQAGSSLAKLGAALDEMASALTELEPSAESEVR